MNLRQFIKERNMSLRQFSKACDISEGHLSGIMSGKVKVGHKTAAMIFLVTGGAVQKHEIKDIPNNFVKKIVRCEVCGQNYCKVVNLLPESDSKDSVDA